ncbi:MAG: hypothetical protein N2316_09220 [Spirochaetes bacterium]|nr:hypothetical protein [Spirochaetota bacterium]
MSKRVLFSDYVQEQIGAQRFALFSVFGEETDGCFLKWTFGLNRFEHFASENRTILVHIPITEKGCEPSCQEVQPYVWNGKVNVAAAESALWHAFEILTEKEAEEFKRVHKPEVIFEFMQAYKREILRVKFIDGDWYVWDD